MPDDFGSNQPPLIEALHDDHADLEKRRDELIAAAERVPEITTPDVANKVADFVKQVQACIKNAEAKRVDAKEPHLKASREVDGFFKGITDPLAVAKAAVERKLTVWQRAQAAIEQKRRDDEARAAREAAEKAAREAAEREATMKSSADLDGAVEAAAVAEQARKDALDAQRAADAKAADMSRARGDFGAVASLRTFWDFSDLDIAALDLEALRQHFPVDAREKAVRSFIKAGGRELRGVRIFENTQTVVR